MTAAGAREPGFTMWNLVDEYPDLAAISVEWDEHVAKIWRGCRPTAGTQIGALVCSYNPASLIRARSEGEPSPPRSAGLGRWHGYGQGSMNSFAIAELLKIPGVRSQIQPSHPRDTVLVADGIDVPAVVWDLPLSSVAGMSVTVSASLLTHPVSITTWRSLLPSPITLEAIREPDSRDAPR